MQFSAAGYSSRRFAFTAVWTWKVLDGSSLSLSKTTMITLWICWDVTTFMKNSSSLSCHCMKSCLWWYILYCYMEDLASSLMDIFLVFNIKIYEDIKTYQKLLNPNFFRKLVFIFYIVINPSWREGQRKFHHESLISWRYIQQYGINQEKQTKLGFNIPR